MRRALYFVLFAMLPSAKALAVILIGSAEADNLLAPANGAPWNYVGQIGAGKGSAIYLGNRYMLTAAHVSPLTPVLLNGTSYSLDATFGAGSGIQIASTDFRIIRLTLEPGLSFLNLIGAGDSDLNQAATIIGAGVGRGTDVANQGWNWGIDTTATKRWGLNTTNGTVETQGQFTFITTSFDLAGGNEEAQITVGDSGSGLFINFGGTWKLAGLGSDVTTSGSAFYDNALGTPGLQPDKSLFSRILPYRDQILAITGTPEPCTAVLGLTGAMVLAGMRRRPTDANQR